MKKEKAKELFVAAFIAALEVRDRLNKISDRAPLQKINYSLAGAILQSVGVRASLVEFALTEKLFTREELEEMQHD